ncbi:MAG: FkbM family methyltransferase [Rhodospirillales bacterium]|nr:FkbM family methyltransferase [Rhodospirillales bacterium]
MKRAFLYLLGRLGYDLVKCPGRISLNGVLANAKRNGLTPKSILDIGAGRGEFTRQALNHFPDAGILMVEPLVEFAPALSALATGRPKVRLANLVASDRAGTVRLNVHPDLFGSSILLEREETDVNGVPRAVEAETLDTLVHRHAMAPPYLLKIDVQGAEGKVLAGAQRVLAETELVILEASLLHFFADGPLIGAILAQMEMAGFALYDLFGLTHRPLDGALAQADLVFARTKGILRRRHTYATPEQRQALTRRLRRT